MSDDGGMTTDEGGISSDNGDVLSGVQVMEELDSNDMECSYPYSLFL